MAQKDGTRRGIGTDTYTISDVALRIFTITVASTNTGAVTANIPAGLFTGILAAVATPIRNTTDPTLACFAMIRSVSPTQILAQVWESKTTGMLLGGVAEGLEPTGSMTVVTVTVFGT